jgi:hypothetical protein
MKDKRIPSQEMQQRRRKFIDEMHPSSTIQITAPSSSNGSLWVAGCQESISVPARRTRPSCTDRDQAGTTLAAVQAVK